MKRYFAKEDTWYDVGTEAFIVALLDGPGWNGTSAIMRGIKEGYEDEELCLLEEFEVIEDD